MRLSVQTTTKVVWFIRRPYIPEDDKGSGKTCSARHLFFQVQPLDNHGNFVLAPCKFNFKVRQSAWFLEVMGMNKEDPAEVLCEVLTTT